MAVAAVMRVYEELSPLIFKQAIKKDIDLIL